LAACSQSDFIFGLAPPVIIGNGVAPRDVPLTGLRGWANAVGLPALFDLLGILFSSYNL
jgi:hypothetical protein